MEQAGYAVLAAHAAQALAGVGLARRPQRAQLAGAKLGRRASCDCCRCSRQDVAVTNLVAARPQVGPDLVRVRVRVKIRFRFRFRVRARARARARVRVRVPGQARPWGCAGTRPAAAAGCSPG